MNRLMRGVLHAAAIAVGMAVLASCGSPSGEGPAPQFGPPVVNPTGTEPASGWLAFGDVDRDGKVDIVLASGAQGLRLLRGRGDGTFRPGEQIPGPAVAYGVAIGDLDGDGNPDLAVIGCLTSGPCTEPGLLLTMAGNGNGTFGAPVAVPTQYPVANSFAPLIADFNADGRSDVAAVWNRPASPIYSEWKEVGIFLGTANGLVPAPDLTVSLGPTKPGHVVNVRVSDANADGKPDLLVYQSAIEGGGGGLAVRLGRGDATFVAGWGINLNCVLASRYAIADFNRDGKADVAAGMGDLCEAPMKLFIDRGDGTFGPGVPIDAKAPSDVPASEARTSYTPVLAGDLDGDGYPDIVLRWTSTSALSLLYGKGDETFHAAVEYAVGVPAGIVRLVDLNGDGRPDLVLMGESGVVTMLNTR